MTTRTLSATLCSVSHLNFSQYLCISISDKLLSFQGLRRTWSWFKWSHYSHSLTSLPHWWVVFKHVLVLLIPYFLECLPLYNGNVFPTQITSSKNKLYTKWWKMKKCWRKIRPQVVHVVLVQGLEENIFFFLDRSGSTHTRDDGVVDKRMQGDGRQNGSYRWKKSRSSHDSRQTHRQTDWIRKYYYLVR